MTNTSSPKRKETPKPTTTTSVQGFVIFYEKPDIISEKVLKY